MTEENNGNGLEKKRFELRAGLAIASFIMMCIFTIMMFFFVPETKLKILSDMSFMIYFSFSGIIAAAMGFKTIEGSKWMK